MLKEMLTEIEIKTINHLGIVAGIIDELQIGEIINQEIGIDPQEIVIATATTIRTKTMIR
jgi:hypothetical protein